MILRTGEFHGVLQFVAAREAQWIQKLRYGTAASASFCTAAVAVAARGPAGAVVFEIDADETRIWAPENGEAARAANLYATRCA